MVDKVYMPGDAKTPQSGIKFGVSWERIENYLRGKPDPYIGTEAVLKPDEQCDFEVTEHGVTVIIK
jgi:hypothetical protein